ncbi:MAG: aspartate-semialdehyde dehydrogenase [Planctomycetota bacterium]
MTNENGISVAVVGATGAVGEAMVEILEERGFPVAALHLLASKRSAGKSVRAFGKSHTVTDLADFDFSQARLGLFSPGGAVSREHAPRAAAAGTWVVDNTSEFRRDPNIPLVVPEVNEHTLEGYDGRIIANPNCSTIQMMLALKPLHDAAGLRRVDVATYQAVSGAGAKGITELAGQTAALLNGKDYDPSAFPTQIAFNAIPQIGAFQDGGFTLEEMKMVWETRKILGDESIEVNPTCVRVPVFYGHSEAVHLELREPLDVDTARTLLRDAPGLELMDDREAADFPTPVKQAAGTDPVFVGRIRQGLDDPRKLNLWVVADNVRKGAALNSVQIAEALLARGMLA